MNKWYIFCWLMVLGEIVGVLMLTKEYLTLGVLVIAFCCIGFYGSAYALEKECYFSSTKVNEETK